MIQSDLVAVSKRPGAGGRRTNDCHRVKFRALVGPASALRRCFLSVWATGWRLAYPAVAAGQLDQPLPAPPEPVEPARPPKVTKPRRSARASIPYTRPRRWPPGCRATSPSPSTSTPRGWSRLWRSPPPPATGSTRPPSPLCEQMEFSPAEVDGKPSPIRIAYTLHFQPKTIPEPEPPPPPKPSRRRRSPSRRSATGRVVVRGRMLERGTREPVIGANVAVVRRGTATGGGDPLAVTEGATDDDGRFEVRSAAAGNLTSSSPTQRMRAACATSARPRWAGRRRPSGSATAGRATPASTKPACAPRPSTPRRPSRR